jgi:TPR repeat protein
MNRLILSFVTICLTTPAFAAFYDAEQLDNIYENERAGLRFYESGDYRSAFKILSKTAAQGMKRSQYILGFMFMKGEGVDKNMLFGLAWMGLSTEADNNDWQNTYDGLYNVLTSAQKSMVDDKINQYRQKFGASAQGVTCARAAVVGSRKQDIICRKSEGSYDEYEIELPIRQ